MNRLTDTSNDLRRRAGLLLTHLEEIRSFANRDRGGNVNLCILSRSALCWGHESDRAIQHARCCQAQAQDCLTAASALAAASQELLTVAANLRAAIVAGDTTSPFGTPRAASAAPSAFQPSPHHNAPAVCSKITDHHDAPSPMPSPIQEGTASIALPVLLPIQTTLPTLMQAACTSTADSVPASSSPLSKAALLLSHVDACAGAAQEVQVLATHVAAAAATLLAQADAERAAAEEALFVVFHRGIDSKHLAHAVAPGSYLVS